jgi:hypothetical protein
MMAQLKGAGLENRRGIIRSSAYRDWRKCPFEYMLRHRWGITLPNLNPAKALWMGQFMHTAFEGVCQGLQGVELDSLFNAVFLERIEKINSDRSAAGRPPMDDELRRELWMWAEMSKAWCQTVWSLNPIDLDRFVILATEVKLEATMPGHKVPTVGVIDAIIQNKKTGEVWILDWKSTAHTPAIYCQAAPFFIQPRLYRFLVESAIANRGLAVIGLDPGAKVVGALHYVIQKPTIRPLQRTGKKSGFKAMMEEYHNRVLHWYRGAGEFQAKGESRSRDTMPFDASWHRWNAKAAVTRRFLDQLAPFEMACRSLPSLKRFPYDETNILPKYPGANAKLNPYMPFYQNALLAQMPTWPGIMKREGFIQSFREDTEADSLWTED